MEYFCTITKEEVQKKSTNFLLYIETRKIKENIFSILTRRLVDLWAYACVKHNLQNCEITDSRVNVVLVSS